MAKNRVRLDVQAGGGREQPWQVRWPLVAEAETRQRRINKAISLFQQGKQR